jgi:hypothetical protein
MDGQISGDSKTLNNSITKNKSNGQEEIRPRPTSLVCLCLQYVINQEPFLSSLSTDMYKRDVGQEEECMTGRTLLVFDLLQLVQVHFAVGTQLR